MSVEYVLREFIDKHFEEKPHLAIGLQFVITGLEWDSQKTPEQKEALIKARLESAARRWREYK